MQTGSRRPSFSSSTTSSVAKRHAATSENAGRATTVAPTFSTRKRAPLGDISNQKNLPRKGSKASIPSSTLVSCSNKIPKVKKGPLACTSSTGFTLSSLPAKSSSITVSKVIPSLPKKDEFVSTTIAAPASESMHVEVSPSKSDDLSISMDETMSTCHSFKSPEVEYMDSNGIPC